MSNIFPTLQYRDARAALTWLNEAFGFEKLFEAPGPDGTIGHAELRLGPGVIMVGSARDDRRAEPGIYVALEDVDAHYDRARSAGAEITRSLVDTDYGSRAYSARDLEGHEWHFGTYRPSAEG